MITPPPIEPVPCRPKPYPGFWQAVGLFALWVFVSIAVAVPGVIADVVLGNKKDEIATHPALIGLGSAAGTVVVLFLARRRTGWGFRRLLAWVPFPASVAMGVVGMTLSQLLFGILGFVWIERAFPGSVPHMDYGFSKSRWLALFLIVIVAPFSEEILMRGVFLRGFAARYGTLRGILLSAVFFALAHVSPARMPHTFLMGVTLGWLYVRTGSLWVNIGAHLLNNLVGGIAFWLAASKATEGSRSDFAVPPFHWSELTLAGLCIGIFLVSMSKVQDATTAPAQAPIQATVPQTASPAEPGPTEPLP